MLRITQLLQTLRSPPENNETRQASAGRAGGQAPVVIWNLLRRCNLACKHCYTNSTDRDYPDELTLPEIFSVLDDLKTYGVRVLIISGGEPLLHPHWAAVAARAKEFGFYVGLSTNGTLMSEDQVREIERLKLDYVGISLDGLGAVHDTFRRKVGAFADAFRAIQLCQAAQIKVGIRYCLTQETFSDLPRLLDWVSEWRISKFYLSHLNYSGRGETNHKMDAFHNMTRQSMELLFERAWEALERGSDQEFVTGNNDADGVYLYLWAKRRWPNQHQSLENLRKALYRWGGNSTGVGIANIGPNGQVHPDSFWGDYDLGSVRARPFSQIWEDLSDPLMAGLKKKPRTLLGRCRSCGYLGICGGNTRVRAFKRTGNPWSEDPGCYLSDDEIGYKPGLTKMEGLL